MKISYTWLRDYVKTDLPPRELAERVTCVGLAVDTIEAVGDDFVLEFDLTSNRPDALSHFGIAREVAAVIGADLVFPPTAVEEGATPVGELASVTIENPEMCPRYAARVIRGIKIGPSPDWLVARLAAVGQRSINNVVDVTNYVLLELGHPLHAFDYDRVAGHRIVVRAAREGETMKTLDGVERKLTPEMLTIADAENPSALAGIMGGEFSEISEASVNVLLESAYFTPAHIRRTARALEMRTEASHRFERGMDPEMVLRALDRCARLIREVAGGEIAAGVIDVYPSPAAPKPIRLRYSRIKALTGVEVAPERVPDILTRLGFTVEAVVPNAEWRVVGPSFRVDIHIEEDLVEEIVRLVGYTEIPATLPGWGGAGGYLPGETERRKIRQALIGQGFAEAISFSWANEARLAAVGSPSPIVLLDPIDQTEDRMRTTLLPGLLGALGRNFNFGTDNARMFEIGKVYTGDTAHIVEEERFACVATGRLAPRDWTGARGTENFHTLKGVLETLFAAIQLDDVTFEAPDGDHPAAYTAGQTARIRFGDTVIGWVGRISPEVAAAYKFKQPVYAAELRLGNIIARPPRFAPYRPLPKFPAVTRDISAMLDAGVSFDTIRREILALGIPELQSVDVRDVYTGKGIPAGKRNLTLGLCYRLEERTLTDEEVNLQHTKVLTLLTERLEAEIR